MAERKNRSTSRAARSKSTGWPLDATGNGRARGMIAAPPKVTSAENRTRLTKACDREAPANREESGASRYCYCEAKTKGTLNVCPSDGGNLQLFTLPCRQLASPG